MLTDQFIAFLPGSQNSSARGIQAVSEVATSRKLELLLDDYAIAFAPPDLNSKRLGPSKPFLVQALPGSIRAGIGRDCEDLPNELDAWESWATRRLQVFNLIHAGRGNFQLLSDPVGFLRYFQAEVLGGLVISSSLKLMVRCFPPLIRPADRLAILETLSGQTPALDRTLHQRIRRSRPGAYIDWKPQQGPRIDFRRRIGAPEIDPRQGSRESLEELHGILVRQLSTGVADPSRVLLPLTGGLDSRLLACAAQKLGFGVEAVTLGLEQHREARVARAVARTVGLKHRVAIPRRRALSRTDIWTDVFEGQCGPGLLFLAEILDLGFASGTTALSGILNDFLAGGGYQLTFDLEDPSRDQLARRIRKTLFKEPPSCLVDRLGIPWSKEACLQEIHETLPQTPVPLQAFQLWNIENDQRRLGHMLILLGQEYHVTIPAYSPENLRRWLSVSPDRKFEKRVLLRIFEELYPRLASIPRAEDTPSFNIRGWEAGRYMFWLQLQRLRFSLARRLLPAWRQRPDPTIVWRLWHDVSREERAHMLETIQERGSVVGEVLDWELPLTTHSPLWEVPDSPAHMADRRLQACYFLVVYCEWLRSQTELPDKAFLQLPSSRG